MHARCESTVNETLSERSVRERLARKRPSQCEADVDYKRQISQRHETLVLHEAKERNAGYEHDIACVTTVKWCQYVEPEKFVGGVGHTRGLGE